MENLSLSVDKRTLTGKSGARAVRRAGSIPGVVYGIKDSTPLSYQTEGTGDFARHGSRK